MGSMHVVVYKYEVHPPGMRYEYMRYECMCMSMRCENVRNWTHYIHDMLTVDHLFR